MNKVSIIIGSKSDSSTMEKTKEILDELGFLNENKENTDTLEIISNTRA